MHLVLTDVLSCPKCGPKAGLIVLADRIDGRRIVDGRLGCPNCQTNYPVVGGVADLRIGNGRPIENTSGYDGDPLRLAALSGITEPRGFALVIGPAASVAARIVELIPNLELAVIAEPGSVSPTPGISPLLVDAGLPFTGSSLRAVIVTGDVSEELLRDCARVVAGGARVVIEKDGLDRELVERSGLKVLVAEGNTIVATRAM